MTRPGRIHLRTVGLVVGAGAIVAATTGTLWLFGLQWVRGLALAVPMTAFAVLVRTLGANGLHSLAWPEPHVTGAPSAGWHHLALLSSSIHEATTDHERFRSIIAPRLRRLAEARLREHNLRWEDPPARDRLGADVYDLLASPPDRAPSMAQIREAISRIEGLAAPSMPVAHARRPLTVNGAAP